MQSNCGKRVMVAGTVPSGLSQSRADVTSFPAGEAVELHCATLAGPKRPAVENI